MPRNGHVQVSLNVVLRGPNVDGSDPRGPEALDSCQAFHRKCLLPVSSKPRARKSGSASTPGHSAQRWPWHPHCALMRVALHEQLEHDGRTNPQAPLPPADPGGADMGADASGEGIARTCWRPTATSAVAESVPPAGTVAHRVHAVVLPHWQGHGHASPPSFFAMKTRAAVAYEVNAPWQVESSRSTTPAPRRCSSR